VSALSRPFSCTFSLTCRGEDSLAPSGTSILKVKKSVSVPVPISCMPLSLTFRTISHNEDPLVLAELPRLQLAVQRPKLAVLQENLT
jgi:hypothetical protein